MWKTLQQLTRQDWREWIIFSLVNGILKVGLCCGLAAGIMIWILMISTHSMHVPFSSHENYLRQIKYIAYPVILFLCIALVGIILGFIRLLKETRVKHDKTYAEKYKQHLLKNQHVDIYTFLDCIGHKNDGVLNFDEFEIKKSQFINDTKATMVDLYVLTAIEAEGNMLLSTEEFAKKKQLVLANLGDNAFNIGVGKSAFPNVLFYLKSNGVITEEEFLLKQKQYKSYVNQYSIRILLFLLKMIIPMIILLFILKYFNL